MLTSLFQTNHVFDAYRSAHGIELNIPILVIKVNYSFSPSFYVNKTQYKPLGHHFVSWVANLAAPSAPWWKHLLQYMMSPFCALSKCFGHECSWKWVSWFSLSFLPLGFICQNLWRFFFSSLHFPFNFYCCCFLLGVNYVILMGKIQLMLKGALGCPSSKSGVVTVNCTVFYFVSCGRKLVFTGLGFFK